MDDGIACKGSSCICSNIDLHITVNACGLTIAFAGSCMNRAADDGHCGITMQQAIGVGTAIDGSTHSGSLHGNSGVTEVLSHDVRMAFFV